MYYGNTWETSKRSNKDKLLVIGTRYRLIKMFLIKFFYSLLKNLHNCFNKTSSALLPLSVIYVLNRIIHDNQIMGRTILSL
jgi:hypothetical protein